MKDIIPPFEGFHRNAFQFLKDLSNNNNTAWFNANRERFQNELVIPARSFVTEIGEFFSRLNPSIRTAPKFNETLMRINKDMRFAKGEPYRNYFLVHFGRFKMDTEFYVFFESDSFQYGIFINNSGDNKDLFFSKNLTRYKKELCRIIERSAINRNFEFYDMKKEMILIDRIFDIKEHYDKLLTTKMILLQKSLPVHDKRIYSGDILIEAIQTFSILYPLYCFSVSSQPLRMITEFEENFGVVQVL